jgi:hypothetical protein
MLGETNGGSGQIEALGGDAIDQLLGRIKGNGNGAGNNGGDNDGGGGGGGGDNDPYDAPATIKMLLDAARQVATFVNTCTTTVMEQQTKFTTQTATFLTEAIVKGRENGQEQMLEIARQLHENATRMTGAVATRLEAIEERLLAIEAHLGGKPAPRPNGAVEDAGGGP